MNYVISICELNALKKLTDICAELELVMTTVFNARGTAVRSMLDILGIESTNRRVVLTVANEEKTKRLIELQKERMFIGVPGHGIVIAVPIKSIGGGKTVAYLNGGEMNSKYVPKLNYSYELIIAITNEGRTDMVMNAARGVGAKGGTVLHGKGTGTENQQKFFNVSIAQEKEVILILSEASQKASIMKAIIEKAGPDTEAGAVVFSLPTSAAAGFGILN
ncbi:MAG: P-II family nitrogen regulator [Clostridiales bacterium]|nr:P-II family nitrogen regulator [Clostridiales bacterium]